MAQLEYDLPDDFDDFDDNAMAQVRKAHRAAQKRIKELESELTTFRTESRKRSVQDVLSSRGYSPKLADLIPENVATEDEVTSWLDERSDLFQPVNPASSEAAVDEQSEEQSVVETPPWARQFSETVNAGQAPSGDESQILAMIQAAKNPEELNKILFGNNSGPAVY
jgi:hypothetical protein